MEHGHDGQSTSPARRPYRQPEIQDLGSVKELTQASAPNGGAILDSTGYSNTAHS